MAFALSPDCRFVVSGNLVRDTIVVGVERIVYGATTWVESILPSIGGNGANTSYGLGVLGVPVTLISACGDDEAGTVSMAQLERVGVDLAFRPTPDTATALTIALVNQQGERAFLHQPGVNRTALAAPLNFEHAHIPVGRPWHYHLANPFALPQFREHAAQSLTNAQRLGATTSLDTGWDSKGRWLDDLAPCLPLVDLLFVNDREAEMLTGFREAGQMVAALHRLGAKRVVLKLGEQGCLLSDEDDREVIPAYHVPVADTTGAGDAFAAGMLAALFRGLPVIQAASFGCAVAGLSVQEPGAVAGLRGYEATHAWICEQEAES